MSVKPSGVVVFYVCLGRGSIWPPVGGKPFLSAHLGHPIDTVCYVTGCASQQPLHFNSRPGGMDADKTTLGNQAVWTEADTQCGRVFLGSCQEAKRKRRLENPGTTSVTKTQNYTTIGHSTSLVVADNDACFFFFC